MISYTITIPDSITIEAKKEAILDILPEEVFMPSTKAIHIKRWTQTCILYDDGVHSIIWGTYYDDVKKRRCMGIRWNEGKDGKGFPNVYGNPTFHVVPMRESVASISGYLSIITSDTISNMLSEKKDTLGENHDIYLDNLRMVENELETGTHIPTLAVSELRHVKQRILDKRRRGFVNTRNGMRVSWSYDTKKKLVHIDGLTLDLDYLDELSKTDSEYVQIMTKANA